VGSAGTAQQIRPTQPPTIAIESLAGRDSFARYCASCHGAGGRGDGPVAAELRTSPADLTSLTQRNDGAFPRDHVRDVVAGLDRGLSAHGTREMPVWGPIFHAFESDARARQRIDNLVTYVESFQRPSTGGKDPGALIFRAYCASCHGVSGRGDGPAATEMRHVPPDLTRFSTRNGGVFPSVKLSRIIDGRDVASHGDREMPVWGDAFRSIAGGMTPEQINSRIEAIVRYLASIQERPAE
jgi:mono/diheme cytochrome c family protein